MLLYVVTVFLAVCAFADSSQKADTIYSHLATKSPYRFNANEDVTVAEEDAACVKKTWMLIRHGTRNPSTGDIVSMNDRLPDVRDIILNANSVNSVLNSDEISLFEKWVPLVTNVADQQILAPEGELENYEMAQRMQMRYPDAFPSVFDNDTYKIRTTDSQRTQESAKFFAFALFGEENFDNVYIPNPDADDLMVLRFYELCSKWQSEVNNNPDTLIEKKMFEASSIMQDASEKVIQALGVTDGLSLKDVQIMYKTCAFETAWSRNESSPWCIPFDLETIKILEYAEDLDYYWVDGYGHELNYKQACPAFGNMINFFNDDETQRKATLYFAHSETVLKFIAHLGLNRDSEPLMSTYINADRKWRVSQIGNFATNVAIVLHDCGDTQSISVRVNENMVRLPACPETDLCDFEVVKRYYDESINCNFDEMCDNV